jgi:hypothetical protein
VSPTTTPTTPTSAAEPQTSVIVDATYQLGLSASDLTAAEKAIFEQAVGQTTTPAPDSATVTEVKVIDGQRRRLINSLEIHTVSVTVRLSYNLANFPTYTASRLSSAVETAVKSSASTNVFGSTLQAIAVANGASSLSEAVIYSVNTETTSDGQSENNSSSSSDGGLAVGAISAIVVCSVSGVLFVLVFIVYWFYFLSNSSVPSSLEDQPQQSRDISVAINDLSLTESRKSEVVL